MTVQTYTNIVNSAKICDTNVKKKYENGISLKWSYYFCKAILNPKKNIPQLSFKDASKSTGSHISRQISRADYLDCARRLVKYVETNKQLPNYITWGDLKISATMYTYLFANILYYYSLKGVFPTKRNINTKSFIKPTETPNVVYEYFVKKTGLKPKTLDDVCDWVIQKVTYLFYFDDQESNKEVIDKKAGNCTDLLQFLCNMAEALGYEWQVIHTQCKQSGTGHVYGQFRKKGNTNWFTRDIACIADNSTYCTWCEVPSKGILLARNPDWFLENLRR